MTFSEPINPTTFDRNDITLTLGGNPVTLGTAVRVRQLSPTEFQVYGLLVPTAAAGDYVLTVNAAGVKDDLGNPGTGSESVNFTVTPPPPNGVVGVAGQIAGPTHDFVITSIPQDPGNDGFINTQSVEFIGYVERTNRGDFTDTHGTLTIEALQNGTVIGTVDFNTRRLQPGSDEALPGQFPTPGNPALNHFDPAGRRLPGDLLYPRPPRRQLLGRYHPAPDGHAGRRSGRSHQSPRSDPSRRSAPARSPRPMSRSPKPIDPATFDRTDLTLTLGGNPVALGTSVRVIQLTPTTFQVYGLLVPTAAAGDYVLTVDASNVQDLAGNLGTGTEAVNFTVTPPPPNGVVGVAGQIAGPTHDFVITSIPQDPDNDGVINTQSVEFVGYVERTNRGDFTDTHGTLTIEALEDGTVIGSVAFNTADFSQDPTKPYRANFRLPATLLSSTSTPQDVVFRVISSTHGTLDAKYSADTTQLLTANLVVELPPTVAEIPPVQTPRTEPVSTVDVVFSKPIDPASFTVDDLMLTRDGQNVPLGSDVTITPIVAQLRPASACSRSGAPPSRSATCRTTRPLPGVYVLTVDATGVRG